jgi:NIPSNAP
MSGRAETQGAVIDLRTYRLRPGAGKEFERIVRDRALPMLDRFGINVVGHGRSIDDDDLYYLLRSFASAAEAKERLAAFYGSDEWKLQHRDGALALIKDYHALLVPNPLLATTISSS